MQALWVRRAGSRSLGLAVPAPPKAAASLSVGPRSARKTGLRVSLPLSRRDCGESQSLPVCLVGVSLADLPFHRRRGGGNPVWAGAASPRAREEAWLTGSGGRACVSLARGGRWKEKTWTSSCGKAFSSGLRTVVSRSRVSSPACPCLRAGKCRAMLPSVGQRTRCFWNRSSETARSQGPPFSLKGDGGAPRDGPYLHPTRRCCSVRKEHGDP